MIKRATHRLLSLFSLFFTFFMALILPAYAFDYAYFSYLQSGFEYLCKFCNKDKSKAEDKDTINTNQQCNNQNSYTSQSNPTHYCVNYCDPKQLILNESVNNQQQNQTDNSTHTQIENSQAHSSEITDNTSPEPPETKRPHAIHSPYFGLLIGYERWITSHYALGLETALNLPYQIALYDSHKYQQWSIPFRVTHRYQFDNGFSVLGKYGLSLNQLSGHQTKTRHFAQIIGVGGGYSLSNFTVNLEYHYVLNPAKLDNIRSTQNQVNIGIVYSIPF